MTLLALDHLAVACETLEDGAAFVRQALGVDLPNAGAHPAMGTHNRLLSLGPDIYLEVIAIDPSAKGPDRPRWFDIDNFKGAPRLSNWIVRTDDMARALSEAPAGMGAPMAFTRGEYRWDMAVPDDGLLPFDGWAPAIITWHGNAHPAPHLPDQGVRLSSLRLFHPQAEQMAESFAPHLPRDTILFEQSERSRMVAVFDTPNGARELG